MHFRERINLLNPLLVSGVATWCWDCVTHFDQITTGFLGNIAQSSSPTGEFGYLDLIFQVSNNSYVQSDRQEYVTVKKASSSIQL